ncbi:MAG: hypothetical protein IJ094_02085, partial [Bacilli bacterium]|nr:hypothetical protein [Bacilli bacterium]
IYLKNESKNKIARISDGNVGKNIVKIDNIIYEKWLPSTSHKIRDGYDYEFYIDDTCYIYIPLE